MSQFKNPKEPSFLQAAIEMGDLIFSATSLAQVKVEYYIFLNTIRYQEYDTNKRITLDEFLHGRKRKDGTRLDTGCGLVSRSSVVKGLADGHEQGHILEETDDKDAARILKRYGLNLPTRQRYTSCTSDSAIDNVTSLPTLARGTESVPQESTLCTSEVHTLYPDQSKYLKKELIESTFTPPAIVESIAPSFAADAALEIIPDSEEDNLKREIDALKAEEAAFPTLLSPERRQEKMQIGMLRMRLQDRLRALQEHASDSQAHLGASERAGLQEANEEENEAHQFTLEELQDTLEGLKDAYADTYNQRRTVRGTPAYDQLGARLQDLTNAQNRVRRAIRALEPPDDDAPTQLFPEVQPAPEVEKPPANNFVAAALALDIPLDKKIQTTAQHSALMAIVAKLKELHLQAAQALEVLRTLITANPWVKEKPLGVVKLLPNYAAAI